jgi:hypothetical protein
VHHGEDGVAPRARELGAFLVRCADHRREQRRFVDAQLPRRFLEVEARRFVDAEDGQAAVMAEVDVVEVQLEELVFRQARVEHHRQDRLDELPPPGALVREEALLHDLLRNRRAALRDAARAHVREERAEDADRIDTDVAAEAHVLRGDEGIDDVLRQVVEQHRRRDAPPAAIEAHDLALGARCARRNHRRLAPVARCELARDAAIHEEEVERQRPHRQKQCDPQRQRPAHEQCFA